MARHDNVKLQLTKISSGGWTNTDNMNDGDSDSFAYVNSPSVSGVSAIFRHNTNFLLPIDAIIHNITITCVGTSAAESTNFNAALIMSLNGEPTETLKRLGARYGVQSSPTTFSRAFTPEEIEEEMKTVGNSLYRQYYQTGDRTKMPTLLDLINGNISKYYTNDSATDTHGFIVGLEVSAAKKALSTAGKVTIHEAYISISYTLPDYILTVATEANGIVTGGGTYESGQTATLTATPNSGYKFVKWSDGNMNATRTVTVTADATYTAIFEKISVFAGSNTTSVYVGNKSVSVYLGNIQIA